LEVAYKNSVIHKTDDRVRFYKGDLFAALPLDKRYKFDIIVCNPPYIKGCEIEGLQKELDSEPRIALDGGPTGLEFYRRIKTLCPDYLKKDGSLFLEIGYGQIEAIKEIFASGLYKIRKVKKDFRGIDRVIWISLP
jgi:release factor glutamine methyltransferase